MSLQQARFNMVEQQIRPWNVFDQEVLDLMERAPRDEYVPAEFGGLAYADTVIPLGDGEEMMPPRVEARLLQALGLGATDRVLEIGTGSGYVTALLADLATHVTSLECSPALAKRGRANLEAHAIGNVSLLQEDGVRGWSRDAPYDAIAVTGSVPIVEDAYQNQLAIGGRLFLIVGEAPAMEALLIRRTAETEWVTESLFETVIPALRGVAQAQRFVL